MRTRSIAGGVAVTVVALVVGLSVAIARSSGTSSPARGTGPARSEQAPTAGMMPGMDMSGPGAPPAESTRRTGSPRQRPAAIGPQSPLVSAAERARRTPATRVRRITLVAAPTRIRIGGRTVSTWAFNGTVPGPEIRVRAGQVLLARVVNRLPAPLTIHWHGIALRNDMDGVPGLTQAAIKPGRAFVYEFTVPDPGTFFYHSHVGTQLDRGLYGPLIVAERAAARPALRDVTVLLDDWVDGTGRSPDRVLATLRAGGRMGMENATGMETPSTQNPLGDDTGDVTYPLYLVNGRPPADPETFSAEPGEQVRLRLVNAGADTPFRVAVAGSRLRVIATDGFPVKPVTVDTLLIGMGERYDAVVTVPRSGVVPLVARAEGKPGQALAVLRAGPGPNPRPDVSPKELAGTLLTLADLEATPAAALPPARPDRRYALALTGDMRDYRWRISGSGATLAVSPGQRVRLVLENRTMMWHPIHLHGHTFQVVRGERPGPRKDTVSVPPMGRVTVDFVADNPGQWALHCHNIYHAEAGMLTRLSYVKGRT